MPRLKHAVYDSDTHFSINPKTRALQNESLGKNCVIQHDHNSERITFELPREIEGHDMTKCDSIQVHYENIDAQTKAKSCGIFEVTDLQPSPDDPDILMLSWLIHGTATKYVGALNFLVRFACVDEATETFMYVWNTAIYTGLSVSSGINNGQAIVEEYPDVLQRWKNDLDDSKLVSMEQTQTSTESNGINVVTATFGNGETVDFQIRNGAKSLIGSIETIDGNPLHFFVGIKDVYNSLPEEIKTAGLYAVITDEVYPYPVAYYSVGYAYGERVSANVPDFVLSDGAEILVKVDSSPILNPDGDPYFSLEVNSTGRYQIFSGEVGEYEYGFHPWSAGDIVRFRFDEAASRWRLVENLTQQKIYEADWVAFDVNDDCFEAGKTYQVRFRWKNHGWHTLSFTIPTKPTTVTGRTSYTLPMLGTPECYVSCLVSESTAGGFYFSGSVYDDTGTAGLTESTGEQFSYRMAR